MDIRERTYRRGLSLACAHWANIRMTLALIPFAVGVTSCLHCRSPEARVDSGGRLVVQVLDSTGTKRPSANVYLLEDPRVTTDMIIQGRAGVWTDENGFGNLGSWRPGPYTLRVRLIGFRPEAKRIKVIAGRTDTVRIVMHEGMPLR
jgi:hypothetical protein